MSVFDKCQAGEYDSKLLYPPYDMRQKDHALWKSVKDACDADGVRLLANFRQELANEHGLLMHPKEDLLYQIAWREGHSEGLYSVAQWYGELAELLK